VSILQGRLVGGGGVSTGGYEPLHLDGLNVKTEDGHIRKYRAMTGFRFPERFGLGEHGLLDEFLGRAAEYGVNCIRWFCVWNNTGFGPVHTRNYYETIEGAMEYSRDAGFYVHLTALCDMKPSNPKVYMPYDGGGLTQMSHVRILTEIARRVGNVLPFEISNEDTDGDSGQTAGWFPKELFHDLIATRSTWMGDENPWLPDQDGNPSEELTAESVHLPRGPEFMVKGKILFECQRQGLGQYPPMGVWTVSGEPQRIAEGTTPRQHADDHAVCELFGGGGLIHGGFSSLPTAHGHETDLQNCVAPERGSLGDQCCNAVRDVWQAELIHPNAAAYGRYTRGGLPDCPIRHVDRTEDPEHGCVRTYAMELDGVMYCVPVDPGPAWKPEPVNGWHLHEQGGYVEDGKGGNVLVLVR
jgi:hypothetical protein